VRSIVIAFHRIIIAGQARNDGGVRTAGCGQRDATTEDKLWVAIDDLLQTKKNELIFYY
jgi:hypothetical protein